MLSTRAVSSDVGLLVCFCSGALLGWQATKQAESIESEMRLFIRYKNNEKINGFKV
jgi:hypothetical protein